MQKHSPLTTLSIVSINRTLLSRGTELNSNIAAFQKKQELDNQTAHTNLAKIQTQKTTADAEALKAATDARKADSEIFKNYKEGLKAAGDVNNPDIKPTGEVDQHGNPLGADKHGNLVVMKVPEGVTAMKDTDLEAFRKTYQAPAIKGEEAYNTLKGFYTNMQNGINNPQEQRDALRTALQVASGMSPTPGAGRAAQAAELDKNMKARGIAADKVNLIENFLNGSQVTTGQMKDIVTATNSYRSALWKVAAANGAVRRMKPEDVIPEGTAGRDRLLNEIYRRPDTSQAARAPGQATTTAKPIPQPPNATHRVPGSDGNMSRQHQQGRDDGIQDKQGKLQGQPSTASM